MVGVLCSAKVYRYWVWSKKVLTRFTLGSTSLVTDAADENGTDMRYCEASPWDKAWGKVRYVNGPAPTDYTYTGQYSYMDDFGLMFYNARWYDP